MNSDREAFSDPTAPSNRWRPLADPSSDSDRAVPHHNRRRTRKAAIIVCSILFIGILESKRRRKQLYLTRELLAPPGSGTVWDRLREVQDRQDDALILTMGIDVHSFAYLLTTDFLSNGTEQQSIEMMSIQEQPAVVLVLKGALSMRLTPSLRKTLMSTGYCYWKSKIRNFRERICM